jgi:uncharacterized protein
MPADPLIALALCAAAFIAGLVDAVVGGGGLVQLPSLLIALPEMPLIKLLGTNRTSSIFGTSVAMLRYMRETQIPWRTMLPAAAVAALGSLSGATVATHIEARQFKPLILVVLIAVTIYTLLKKDFGRLHAPKLNVRTQRIAAMLLCAPIGFYDGFLGPGTGSFLIFAFVGVLGFSFLAASASAKVINVATNLTSFIYFLVNGFVILPLGLLMAACNVAGSVAGTRLALRFGSGFVRALFLIVVPLVIARFAWDIAQGK